jgi:hypothetical protein
MKSSKDKNSLLNFCRVFDTDYSDYGGQINRKSKSAFEYSDCSCGCMYFVPLYDAKNKEASLEYGVCINEKSKRCGFLTHENQAGYGCFKVEKY